MRVKMGLINGRDACLFSGNGQNFSRNPGTASFQPFIILFFSPAVVMAIVNRPGPGDYAILHTDGVIH